MAMVPVLLGLALDECSELVRPQVQQLEAGLAHAILELGPVGGEPDGFGQLVDAVAGSSRRNGYPAVDALDQIDAQLPKNGHPWKILQAFFRRQGQNAQFFGIVAEDEGAAVDGIHMAAEDGRRLRGGPIEADIGGVETGILVELQVAQVVAGELARAADGEFLGILFGLVDQILKVPTRSSSAFTAIPPGVVAYRQTGARSDVSYSTPLVVIGCTRMCGRLVTATL